jgi:hypothetical protein
MARRGPRKTNGNKLRSSTTATASKNGKHNREQRRKEQLCKEAWREVQSFARQVLAEVIDGGKAGPEALLATRVQVLHLFVRIESLRSQIHEAFDGQAFLPNAGGPTSRTNRRRFNAYVECHKKLTELLFEAVGLWAMSSV